MKIHGRYEFEKLIHRRNQFRDLFAKSEEEIETKYGFDILKSSRNAEKYNIFCYLQIIALLLYTLLTYKYIDNVLVIVGLVVLVAVEVFLIIKFIKWMKIEQNFRKLFNDENKGNLINKEKLEEYNYLAIKCAILIICYSENFYTLENLDEKSKKDKLIDLFYKYLRAIDSQHNYKATIDDYLNYYYIWERKYL